jgi:transcription-repair coupling factor (superfamily II helicase)
VQSLARRLEQGGALSCAGVHAAAQPFLAALLRQLFPARPIIVVTDSLKTQESFQQDLTTWLQAESKAQSPKSKVEVPQSSPFKLEPLFYPAWEILPHEGKLPHADIVSDRLETLVALAGKRAIRNPPSAIVVTSVTAWLQKTFAPPGRTDPPHSHVSSR